jgi:hypothetical protein
MIKCLHVTNASVKGFILLAHACDISNERAAKGIVPPLTKSDPVEEMRPGDDSIKLFTAGRSDKTFFTAVIY